MSTTVVVLGATGIVGQGVVHSFLNKNFTVYAVSRSADKLKKLEADLQKVGTKGGKLVQVVGDFKTPEEAQAVVKQIATDFHHVVSVLGFVDTIPKLASETTPEEFVKNWEGSFFLIVRAANAFVPLLKNKPGSFTVVSGGFAHGVFIPQMWAGTLKNGTFNVWSMVLEAELKNAPLRWNNICIHFGVAEFGGQKNQFGMAAADTRELGPSFLALALNKDARKGTICLATIEDAKALTKELGH